MLPTVSSQKKEHLRTLAYQSVLDLSDERGIIASSRTEAYGCIFGRDSAISTLKLLNTVERSADLTLLNICKTTLLNNLSLQGTQYNMESGEEPGKCIHEYRPDNYERLINRPKPWYVYPDGILRNYDSVDATVLLLTALYRYWEVTQDEAFIQQQWDHVVSGINWILTDADKDQDTFLEYELPSTRISGGLVVQSWTDSFACLTQADGSFPIYPIAAIEVQAMAWKCLSVWAHFLEHRFYPQLSADTLFTHAQNLKNTFQEHFLQKDSDFIYGVQALDGRKNPIKTITANPLLALWASYQNSQGQVESILDSEVVDQFVERAFQDDLFHPGAGIRTMSRRSPLFDGSAHSYHNGSFWPMLNGLIHEGLQVWGFEELATELKESSLQALAYFDTPIELYQSNTVGEYEEYVSPSGKKGCRVQAWTAACMLDWLTE